MVVKQQIIMKPTDLNTVIDNISRYDNSASEENALCTELPQTDLTLSDYILHNTRGVSFLSISPYVQLLSG